MAVGIIVGLAIAERVTSFEAFSSLGTFGAAIAAFWAVSLNSRDQRRKRAQDERAEQPYLIISDADFQVSNGSGYASIAFTNLSQHPVHLRDAVIYTDDGEPDVINVGLLVPPSETATYKTVYNVHFMDNGKLVFMFNYAPTGPVLHSLSLPYRRWAEPRITPPEEAGIPAFSSARVGFAPADQELKINVEDESKQVYELLDEMHNPQN